MRARSNWVCAYIFPALRVWCARNERHTTQALPPVAAIQEIPRIHLPLQQAGECRYQAHALQREAVWMWAGQNALAFYQYDILSPAKDRAKKAHRARVPQSK